MPSGDYGDGGGWSRGAVPFCALRNETFPTAPVLPGMQPPQTTGTDDGEGLTDLPLWALAVLAFLAVIVGATCLSATALFVLRTVRRAAEASGRAPAARSWFSLKAAATDRATLADLSRTADEDGAEAEPFWPIRLAEPFERLRDLADQRTAAGRAPKVFLGALGPLSEHTARVQYAQNFFAAGGIRTRESAADAK